MRVCQSTKYHPTSATIAWWNYMTYTHDIIEESNSRMRILIWIDTPCDTHAYDDVAWRILESSRSAPCHAHGPWVSIAWFCVIALPCMNVEWHSKHGWLDPWLDPAHGRMPAACRSVLYTWDNLLIGKIYIEKKTNRNKCNVISRKEVAYTIPWSRICFDHIFFSQKGCVCYFVFFK